MDSRTHLGLAALALSFVTIGVALGACASVDSSGIPGGAEAAAGAGTGGKGIDDPLGSSSGLMPPGSSSGLAGAGGDGAGYGTGGAGGGFGGAGDTGGSGPAGVGGNEGPTGGNGGNPFQDPPPPECQGIPEIPRTVYMSADDSNSMASPAVARALINMGFEPKPGTIRTYEFLNYYQIAYDPAAEDHLAIYAHLEQKKDKPEVAELQIGVRSFDAFATRRPMNITIIVDTSGSMKGPGLEVAKAAVTAMGTHFVQGDKISVVAGADSSKWLDGHDIAGPEDKEVQNKVAALTAAGAMDLSTALKQAYEIAGKYYDQTRMNRVVVLSDGDADIGILDTDYLAAQTEDANKEGIYLVGAGVGPALSYNDGLMNAITDAGRGAYVYLDSIDEAAQIFDKRFDETMDIAARDVQVELTLPYYFLVKGVSPEFISDKPVAAQHLAPHDAMVFNVETNACHPVVYTYSDNIQVRVTWKRRTYEDRFNEISVPLSSLTASPQLAKGRAIVAYAEALKGCYGEPGCTETKRMAVTKEKLVAARDLAQTANPAGTDLELNEIVTLINKHPLLQ